MKFYKSKKVEGVYVVREENGKVMYVFGLLRDLIKAELVFPAFDQNGNRMEEYEAKTWGRIDRNGVLGEFDSKEELKAACV